MTKTKDLEVRLQRLEEMLMNKEKCDEKPESSTEVQEKPVKQKTKRSPSAYNVFVKEYLETQKAEKGSSFDRKTAFAGAAKAWNEKKESTKAKKGWFD